MSNNNPLHIAIAAGAGAAVTAIAFMITGKPKCVVKYDNTGAELLKRQREKEAVAAGTVLETAEGMRTYRSDINDDNMKALHKLQTEFFIAYMNQADSDTERKQVMELYAALSKDQRIDVAQRFYAACDKYPDTPTTIDKIVEIMGSAVVAHAGKPKSKGK
ncbi:hypothetical protein [Citrobacter portucalensis]|uniref:hypothetical protein n=1 Tax=Citrobacter portucalensis TaxID=1639133 RepID=UPI0023B34FF5|nr:hypothetical protein [Citrobacter portucalensis]MDE9690210.1 hypothetical protein [Citrobacter portucalensis]WOU50925.1 hypothetical protein R4T22_06695 [Citrobacter portucalensis]